MQGVNFFAPNILFFGFLAFVYTQWTWFGRYLFQKKYFWFYHPPLSTILVAALGMVKIYIHFYVSAADELIRTTICEKMSHPHICLLLHPHLHAQPVQPTLDWQPRHLKLEEKHQVKVQVQYTCLASVRTDMRSRAWKVFCLLHMVKPADNVIKTGNLVFLKMFCNVSF